MSLPYNHDNGIRISELSVGTLDSACWIQRLEMPQDSIIIPKAETNPGFSYQGNMHSRPDGMPVSPEEEEVGTEARINFQIFLVMLVVISMGGSKGAFLPPPPFCAKNKYHSFMISLRSIKVNSSFPRPPFQKPWIHP